MSERGRGGGLHINWPMSDEPIDELGRRPSYAPFLSFSYLIFDRRTRTRALLCVSIIAAGRPLSPLAPASSEVNLAFNCDLGREYGSRR